jgi:tetratricopeptide (TPR) repeat protein
VLGFRLRVEVRLRAEQTKSISLPVLHIFGIRLKKDDRFVSEQTVWWEDLDSYQFVIIGGAGETAEILIDGSRSQTVLLSSLKVLTPGHSPKGERGYEQQEIAEVRLSQLRPFICKSSTQVTVRCQGLEKRIAIKMNACILLFDYLDETSNQIESGQIAFKTVLKGPTDLKAKFTAFSPMGEKLTEKTISCPGLQERAYQETLSVSSEREVTVKASVQDAERRYVAYSQELRFEAVDAATLIVKYEQQLQSNPENSEIRYRLAQLYDKQGDYEKAASHYRQLLTHLQKDIPKLLSIAEFFERHGNEREALDSYRKAYEWEPQNSQIKQRYILCWLKHPWLTENELYRIWQFIYSGQQPQNDAQIHFLSGIRFYVIGKVKDALFCFEQCQTFPDATLVWMYKSIACFCDGRYEKAREYAAQVLSERPGAFDPWPQLIQIASCYLQQNRESFEQELSQPPDTLSIKAQSIPTDLILRPNEIHLLQAIYYYLKGQFDKAKSHIDQVEPESECAKVVKARIYRRIIGGKEIAKDLYIDLYRRNSLDYCKEAETYLREIGCL